MGLDLLLYQYETEELIKTMDVSFHRIKITYMVGTKCGWGYFLPQYFRKREKAVQCFWHRIKVNPQEITIKKYTEVEFYKKIPSRLLKQKRWKLWWYSSCFIPQHIPCVQDGQIIVNPNLIAFLTPFVKNNITHTQLIDHYHVKRKNNEEIIQIFYN